MVTAVSASSSKSPHECHVPIWQRLVRSMSRFVTKRTWLSYCHVLILCAIKNVAHDAYPSCFMDNVPTDRRTITPLSYVSHGKYTMEMSLSQTTPALVFITSTDPALNDRRMVGLGMRMIMSDLYLLLIEGQRRTYGKFSVWFTFDVQQTGCHMMLV